MNKPGWKERVRRLRRDVKALALAVKHPDLPWPTRVVALIAVGYALCPLDLVPDFIPVLGMVDDLIILPLLVILAIKLMPRVLLDECRRQADTRSVDNKAKWVMMGFIILVWAVLLGSAGLWLARLLGVNI